MKKDIYIIKNKINDKVYIGQADFAWKRWGTHIRDSRSKPKTLIDKAIRKYGVENFWYELLEGQVEDYDEREMYWIQEYDSIIPNGYNVSPGGKGVGRGVKHPSSSVRSEEVLRLIIDDIKDGELTLEQISNKYQIGFSVVQGINSGQYYHNDDIQYPIRSYFLSEERLNRLIYSLKYELDKTVADIAKDFDLCPSTVSEINNGKEKHLDWVEYPIRTGKVTNPLYTKHNEVKKILAETNMTYKEIARKYDVSLGAIQSINEGHSWRDNNISYPIRKGGCPIHKNLSQDQIKEIEDMLANTDISMIKISEKFCCSPGLIQNINRGKIKKYLNDNITYPIRRKTAKPVSTILN